MSYILDALRKAEQKRQLAAKVPTLATIHRQPAAVRPPIRLRLWPWVAGAVIVVNAGVVTWLLLPAGTRSTASLDRPGSFSTPGTAAPSAPGATASPAPGPRAAPLTADGPVPSAPAAPRAPATPGPPVAAPPAPARGPASEPGRATTNAAETKVRGSACAAAGRGEPDQPRSDQKPHTAVAPVPPASSPTAEKPSRRRALRPLPPHRSGPPPRRIGRPWPRSRRRIKPGRPSARRDHPPAPHLRARLRACRIWWRN